MHFYYCGNSCPSLTKLMMSFLFLLFYFFNNNIYIIIILSLTWIYKIVVILHIYKILVYNSLLNSTMCLSLSNMKFEKLPVVNHLFIYEGLYLIRLNLNSEYFKHSVKCFNIRIATLSIFLFKYIIDLSPVLLDPFINSWWLTHHPNSKIVLIYDKIPKLLPIIQSHW